MKMEYISLSHYINYTLLLHSTINYICCLHNKPFPMSMYDDSMSLGVIFVDILLLKLQKHVLNQVWLNICLR